VTILPASVEQYLSESGFSGTEILILKHLLEGGAMTLRELAGKTGKSTGVLDSASKKLLSKGILAREVINDSPRLKLASPEAIMDWIREDRRSKDAAAARREKDVESFIASLSINVSRADIQHYEGIEGLGKAYLKLLEVSGGTMLHFLPVRHTETEDPLRDFLVQFFRLRHRQKIITRVIAHDTPLGRRYQSRDPFEYRQTLLVAEDVYAFGTEKVVAGDWVGTFNHPEQRAFLIRSKEMAQTEKAMFEALWKQEMAKKAQAKAAPASDSSVPLLPSREV
jgi:predicted DNA-binding transcriptional regulator